MPVTTHCCFRLCISLSFIWEHFVWAC